VSEQPGLFSQEIDEPHGLEWLTDIWMRFKFHPEADHHAYWFGRNTWRLLQGTKHWADIQGHVIDAMIWAFVVAKSYDNFTALVFGDAPFEDDLLELLSDTYSEQEQVVDAVLRRFFGYSLDDIESGGWPDAETVGWWNGVVHEEAKVRGRLTRVLREVIGPSELILNFYRDPFGWHERLAGNAMPKAQEQQPLELGEGVEIETLFKAAEKCFDVFL
jgi:hypothetical protein